MFNGSGRLVKKKKTTVKVTFQKEVEGKTSQECETALTSQYKTLFLDFVFCLFVFCFLSFCIIVFLSFCLFDFLSFCLFIFSSFCFFCLFLSFCRVAFLSCCLFVFLSCCIFVQTCLKGVKCQKSLCVSKF